eukprot:m.448133 g.448133  ORF g.448133 m.448133 type:complete len:68 (-) comp56889_c0_seq10:965-1168(-)
MALVRRDLTRDFAELRQKSAAPALAAASVSPQWLYDGACLFDLCGSNANDFSTVSLMFAWVLRCNKG